MKKISLLCILLCTVLLFASCGNNNVDTSDDGEIGDGTTIDMTPNDDESNSGNVEGGTEHTTTDGENDGTDDENEDMSDSEDDSQNQEQGGNTQSEKKTITSDTGTGINLVIEYTVGDKANGSREIAVDVYIESYSLNVTSRGNTNYVRVGDETFYFSTEAISYDGTAKKMTKVASHTFTTDTENETLPIYALWNFNGVYSEKPISTIIIENTIQL